MRILFNGEEFTIPKEKIKLLALQQAMSRGIFKGNIHDEKTAIEYLESLGMIICE